MYNCFGIYIVGVIVDNILVIMYVIKDIVIEKVVEKILMNVSFLMYYGDLMYFIIYIEEFGIDICLILDFKDLYVMFMGELCCRFLLLFFNNKFFELNFN